MSFFRSRSKTSSEAYQPLVTSLPTRRRKTDVSGTGKGAHALQDVDAGLATLADVTEAAPKSEAEVMRTIFAELNSITPSSAPSNAPADAPAAGAPDTEVAQPVPMASAAAATHSEAAAPRLVAIAPTDLIPTISVAIASPEIPAESLEAASPVAASPVAVPDDDSLRALFAETLGDAFAAEPETSEPQHIAVPAVDPAVATTAGEGFGGFADHTDDKVIGMLRDAEAALAGADPVAPAERRWPWQRKNPRPKASAPSAAVAAATRPEKPTRPARAPRKPIRIPGTRAERWLLATLAAPLALIILGAVAGGLAALVTTLLVGFLVILSRDISQIIPGRTEMPLPPEVLRLAPAATLFALGLGLAGLALPLVSGFATWIFTLIALAIWLAQGPARIARDAAASRDRKGRRAAQAVFALLLLPHRPATERLLHRRLAATPEDPLTAEAGESYYEFAARAVPDALRDALAMERQTMTPRLGSPRGGISPLLLTALASLIWLGIATAIFGPLALSVLVALAVCVEAQLLMRDYLASYGLQRRRLAHNRVEPLGPGHRWAAPPALGHLAAQLTGTRPAGPGQDGAPVLPHSAARMAMRALVPPLWHGDLDARVMTMTKAGLRGAPAPLR